MARGYDVYGGFLTSSSNNLIGINTGLKGLSNGTNGNQIGTSATSLAPRLTPLQDNGGPTWTHALMEDSPAIDAGNVALAVDHRGDALVYDQRGRAYRRVAGIAIDIGAFERDTEVVIDASQEYYFVNSDGSLVILPEELADNSTDMNWADIVAQVTGTPSHGTITVLPDGSVEYTPTSGYIGTDTIEYTVSRKDGTGTATGTIMLEVCPPVTSTAKTGTFNAVADTATIFNNADVNNLDVLKNDIFASGQYGQITNVGTSTKGTATIIQQDGRNMIAFTPNAGATGSTTLSYTVKDSNGTTKTATVSIQLQSTPSAWQSSGLITGEIAIGGSTASLTPGNGFTPIISGNVETSFSNSGAMNSMNITGEPSVSGTGTQGTSASIVSMDFGNGDYWYHEYVHWTYSITANNGDSYSGSYSYTLTASKINGLEQYTLNVISTDHYSVTDTTNTVNEGLSSTLTEHQTGTTRTTIRLGESYNPQIQYSVNGYDYRTTDVNAKSDGVGTYCYDVPGGTVNGGTNSNSRSTSRNSVHYVYRGTRGNVSAYYGTYYDTTREDSSNDFSGSGTTFIENTSGSGTPTITNSEVTGKITESGHSEEHQRFHVIGQYLPVSNQWNLINSGTVDSSSNSIWRENSTTIFSENTNTPTNKRNYESSQEMKNVMETSDKLNLTFQLVDGQWAIATGTGSEYKKTTMDSEFGGTGTYEQSGSGSTSSSPFDTWHKSGSFSDEGGMNQESETTVRVSYSSLTGSWSKSGSGSTTGHNDYTSEYSGSGTYTKEILLGSSSGGDDGKIQFTQGETTENGAYQYSRNSTIHSLMDNSGVWTSTGTADETVSGSDDTTYSDSDGVFTIANLNVTGSADESGENHESFAATLNYTIQNGSWQQVGGTQDDHSSMSAALSYSGSGTTTDTYLEGTLISRSGGTADYSLTGDGTGTSGATAYMKTITVNRNISLSQQDENETTTDGDYINNAWKTTSGNGSTSGENTSTYNEDYSGFYDKGHRSWDQASPAPSGEVTENWSYVSGTLSGSSHSYEHTDYGTTGTWNATSSKWDTTGTLNSSFSGSSHDENSGGGNYLNVRNVGVSGANNYLRQAQSGTITESSLDNTTHDGHSKSVWGNTGDNTEGWLLSSGSATNTGDGETVFSTNGNGAFSWQQNVYGTGSMAESHSGSGSTSNSSYSFNEYNYSETYTPQPVTRNNVTKNEWVLTEGSGAATQNSTVFSSIDQTDNYRKKMDTYFDAFSGRTDEYVSDTSIYNETLNFGRSSEFDLSKAELPTLVAVSGTATLTEDGSSVKSETEFDRSYKRMLVDNNVEVGEVKGLVGNTTTETEDYHFDSDFEFKLPTTSSSSKEWVHTSGTGQQTLTYDMKATYDGSGSFTITAEDDLSTHTVLVEITESGTIKGSTSGSGAIFDYTFTEGNTEWKVTGSTGLTTEHASFIFTETRSSIQGNSKELLGTASWDYKSDTIANVNEVEIGQNKATCTETTIKKIDNSHSCEGSFTISDGFEYGDPDIVGTMKETEKNS